MHKANIMKASHKVAEAQRRLKKTMDFYDKESMKEALYNNCIAGGRSPVVRRHVHDST